jgi:hypothetical protein
MRNKRCEIATNTSETAGKPLAGIGGHDALGGPREARLVVLGRRFVAFVLQGEDTTALESDGNGAIRE